MHFLLELQWDGIINTPVKRIKIKIKNTPCKKVGLRGQRFTQLELLSWAGFCYGAEF